jgi:hypothetical protein
MLAWLAAGALAWGTAHGGPTVQMEPYPVVVSPGETVQVKATVVGPSEYKLRWILQGPIGDDARVGNLSQEGLYTAPEQLPRGPVRIVVQVSLGQYDLPVAAASVPVDIFPTGMKPPTAGAPAGLPPPPPPPAPPEPPEPAFQVPQR